MTEPLTEAERVLRAVADDGLSVEAAADALLDATFVLPLVLREDGSGVIDPMTHEDVSYAPLYTHMSRIPPQLGDGREPSGPTLRQLAAQLPIEWGIVVNPAGPWAVSFGVEWLRWRMGLANHEVPAGTRIRMGDPAVEPTAFLDALAELFAGVPGVVEARRMWAAIGDEDPGLVIGVTTAPPGPELRRAVNAAVDGAVAAVHPAHTVTLVFTDDGGPMVEWMREHAEPFHRQG